MCKQETLRLFLTCCLLAGFAGSSVAADNTDQGTFDSLRSITVPKFPGGPASLSELEQLNSDLKSYLSSHSVELNLILEQSGQLLSERRFDKAESLIRSARSSYPDLPDLLVRHAQALAGQNGGSLAGEAFEIISRSLDIDYRHKPSLWLMALYNQQVGNHEAALILLTALKHESGGDKNGAAAITRSIEWSISQLAEVATPGTAIQAERVSQKPQLSLWISLSDTVMEQFSPDDTVFVYARQSVESGTPLAVTRRRVADFPTTVVLDDTMSMVPSQSLSSSRLVTVGARASRSGTAMPYKGDWEGVLTEVPVSTRHVIPIVVDYELK